MKCSVAKKTLVKSLSHADTIAGSKSTIPVLSNVLLDTQGNEISILSSNLETGIKITDSVGVEEEGALAVNGRKLLSIIRELPEDDVIISSDEHNRLTVRSLSSAINAQFTIAGVSKDEFPEVRAEPDGDYIGVDAETFKSMIRKVIFSISSDENKYSLTGIFLEKDEDTINMVATDGKRLALVTRRGEELGVNMEQFEIPHDGVIVPKIVFSELLKYSFEKNSLRMGFSKNQIFFSYDNIRLASNLIEGKYPEYKKIIPADRTRYLIVEKSPFTHAIKRVSVLVDESYNQIKLSMRGGIMTLSSQNPTLGGAVEEISVEYEGEDIDIALNYVYLIDCLKEIDSDRITIDFENAERVITVKGSDEVGYINLIMPMKLNV
jgi:DNA polymerase-3 subunit beta